MKAYVFRGSSASGKGTIVKEFVKELPGKVAVLELDTFRWGFHLWNRTVADVTPEEHAFAYQHFLSSLELYCKNGNYTLVVEGLFSWDTPGPHGDMQDIIAIFKKYNVDHRLFLLYGDYEVLEERNAKRDYVVPQPEFKELYEYVMQKTSDEETHINVGEQSVPEIVQSLKTYI